MNAETINTVLDEINSEEAYPSVSDDIFFRSPLIRSECNVSEDDLEGIYCLDPD